MGLLDDFLVDFKTILADEVGLDDNDINEYCNILIQYPSIVNSIANDYKKNEKKLTYVHPFKHYWGTNGQIQVNEYTVELCCYGDLALNIYKHDRGLSMLTNKQRRIDEIKREIEFLEAELRELENTL